MRNRFPMLQILAMTLCLGVTGPLRSQTVINMPPPPRPAEPDAVVETAGANTNMTAAQVQQSSPAYDESQVVTVGDVALTRYSRARFEPYDTYYSEGLYSAGIRTYSYPQYIWGPWFGWGFGFHHHHGCK